MNDYSIGTLEALAYALAVLEKHFDEKDEGPVNDAYSELEEVELKIVKASAVHFQDRLSLLPKVEV